MDRTYTLTVSVPDDEDGVIANEQIIDIFRAGLIDYNTGYRLTQFLVGGTVPGSRPGDVTLRVGIEPHDDAGHVPSAEEAATVINDLLVNDRDFERGWSVKKVELA